MADIWALSFSDIVLAAWEKQEENTTEEIKTEEPKEEIVEEAKQEPEVPKEEETKDNKTLEDIHKELELESMKQEQHEETENVVQETIKKKPLSSETLQELEEIMPQFYRMYDEAVDEKNRYKVAFETLSSKYEAVLKENEDMKYSLRKAWDIDEDLRYMSKLKKDENAADDYADTLIWELSKAYKLNEYELRKDIKEKRQRQLNALSWISETKVVEVDEVQEKVETPLFEGFKITPRAPRK